MASFIDPQCGVPLLDFVDAPNSAQVVHKCVTLSARVNGGVWLVVALAIVILSVVWTTPSDPNDQSSPRVAVLSAGWAVVPLLLGAYMLFLSPVFKTQRFRTDQASFVASGMTKTDWLNLRQRQAAARQQAAAITGAGLDIASGLFQRR